LLADECEQPPDGGRIELRRGAARVRLGLDGTGRTPSLQEADEKGEIDGEEVGDLAERVFTAVDGGDDAFPEIEGVRTHGSTSFVAAPQVILFRMLPVCEPL
jgi:hypothetical protein